jgi:hypothetical protein
MQQGVPTVGDTVTIVRWIAAPAGAVIEARPPADSATATLTAPPVLTREGDSVRVAYTVAVWVTGRNDLVLPGAIIVEPSGRVDTLADSHVALNVASVLPAAKSVAAIAPRTARPWLPRSYGSELPFAVLLPAAIAGVVLLQWWWRRLGAPPTVMTAALAPAPLTDTRVSAWVAAGEARLALDHIEWLIRDRADFADWRQRAAEVRFAPGGDATVAALVAEAWSRLTDEPGRGPTS